MKEKEYKALPETGYLRLPDVLRFIPVSKTTWWNGVRSGRFPRSVKLSPGVTTWRAEDIKQLIESF
jgi:prophage regulatory protein